MDFGSREILITLGVLVMLGIVLDGLRRMRSGREGTLRSSMRKQPIFEEEDINERMSELPSGGARVVGYRDEQTADQLNDQIRHAAEEHIHKVTTAFRELEQVPLALEESSAVEEDALNETDLANSSKGTGSKRQATAEPIQTMVLHLMAPKNEVFPGLALREVLRAEHLYFGEHSIFHRYHEKKTSGAIHFSLANAVNPGTFELDEMDEFSTPGLTFFMVLEDSDQPLSVFDDMLMTAQALLETLGGELQDENRSTLTNQTLAHCRQQVVDYTRCLS